MANKKFLRRPSNKTEETPKPEPKPTPKPQKRLPPRPTIKNELDPDALLAELEEFEMDSVFAFSQTKRRRVGDTVTGIIQDIVGDIALVNIGGKAEASLLADPSFEAGQQITATIIRVNHTGIVLAQKIEQGNDMEAYEAALDRQLPITGKVIEKNTGGYVVNFGDVRGFCPLSQISLRRSLEEHINQEYSFVITEIKGKELIVSRRTLLENELKEKEASILGSLQAGRKYTGTVQNIADFGIFISIKGMDGLLPKSELQNQETKFDIGQEIEVILHSINGKRLSLRLAAAKRQAIPELSDAGATPTFGDAFGSIFDDFLKK